MLSNISVVAVNSVNIAIAMTSLSASLVNASIVVNNVTNRNFYGTFNFFAPLGRAEHRRTTLLPGKGVMGPKNYMSGKISSGICQRATRDSPRVWTHGMFQLAFFFVACHEKKLKHVDICIHYFATSASFQLGTLSPFATIVRHKE